MGNRSKLKGLDWLPFLKTGMIVACMPDSMKFVKLQLEWV